MKKEFVGISVALLVAVASQASPGSNIENGSFETGDFTGWTATGNLTVTAFGSGANVPSDGLYGLVLNGGDKAPNGELSQSFSADIGTTYLLEFDFANGGLGFGTASVDVKVEGLGSLLDEVVSDTTGGMPGAYSTYSFSFTADSTDMILSFADTSNGTIAFDGALDDISVIAIPEPSSLAMIGLVSGSAVFIRRRFLI